MTVLVWAVLCVMSMLFTAVTLYMGLVHNLTLRVRLSNISCYRFTTCRRHISFIRLAYLGGASRSLSDSVLSHTRLDIWLARRECSRHLAVSDERAFRHGQWISSWGCLSTANCHQALSL